MAAKPAIHSLITRITFMKTFKPMVALLDRAIWMIGLLTIVRYPLDYSLNHWPTAYAVVCYVVLGGFGVWYFRKYFLLPFQEGLNGR